MRARGREGQRFAAAAPSTWVGAAAALLPALPAVPARIAGGGVCAKGAAAGAALR